MAHETRSEMLDYLSKLPHNKQTIMMLLGRISTAKLKQLCKDIEVFIVHRDQEPKQ